MFDDVDLSCVLFHNCDVSQVWFTTAVQWRVRKRRLGEMVFDEEIPLDQEHARGLKRNGRRDYWAISQSYRQLKKNFDARLDYGKANSFHFSEMEMRQLAESADRREIGYHWFSHPRLNLLFWYKLASNYGNSYRRAMLWLVGILVLFTALWPLPGVGLKPQGARRPETYTSVWRAGDGWIPNLWAEVHLIGRGAITSVDTATFQKSAEYAPAYPWGRVLAIFETLLTSILFGLFLLAIRRQFRR